MKWLTALLILCASMTQAQGIRATGEMSDRDFYRAISCGAAPGEICQHGHKRWSPDKASALSIGVHQVQTGYPAGLEVIINDALQIALRQINAAGTPVQIAFGGDQPDIRIYLVAARQGETIENTDFEAFDGAQMTTGLTVTDNQKQNITLAAIALPSNLDTTDVRASITQHLLQALGFPHKLDNATYRTRSVFYANDHLREDLGPPDLTALAQKYAY